MNTLDGKTIVIDGVEYRLVAVSDELQDVSDELKDNRTKAIMSVHTDFGVVSRVVDRDELKEGIGEGEIVLNGISVNIEFCREDEVKEKLGDANDFNLLDVLFSSLGKYNSSKH